MGFHHSGYLQQSAGSSPLPGIIVKSLPITRNNIHEGKKAKKVTISDEVKQEQLESVGSGSGTSCWLQR